MSLRSKNKLVLAVAALALCAFAACEGDSESDVPGDGSVTVDPTGDVPQLDNPNELSTSAGLRRMTVDQLQAAVTVVAGTDVDGEPIFWRYPIGATTYNAYDDKALGKVLGRPDYVTVTSEDPSPSSLYIKFAQDMARSVCADMVTADLGRVAGDDPTLWRFASVDGAASDEDINQNVRYLTLRFLGLSLEADDSMILALVQLYKDGIASIEHPELSETPVAAEGWRAVCVGLFEDPAFHLH